MQEVFLKGETSLSSLERVVLRVLEFNHLTDLRHVYLKISYTGWNKSDNNLLQSPPIAALKNLVKKNSTSNLHGTLQNRDNKNKLGIIHALIVT